ncbi:MAG: tripartite tricarboxylate transporter permease [Rhodospirillales bacterium]
MEGDMWAMAVKAALIMADPSRIAFLMLGVVMGLVIGVIPGLGGLVGLSLLLPFTFNMDPYTALALMIGLASVTVTSDTIPAVLFGVPGTVGSAATILDGHPMARKGEARRAFGAAFSASVIGGVFGAVVLALSVPILRPVMLAIGTPELLAVCVFGLSLVAVLSGASPLKGLAAACLGIMVATVGEEAQSATSRWTFEWIYLWDGLPIVPFALGLFAIPELADLAISRMKIARDNKDDKTWTQWHGVKDTLRNWFLVIRCSLIGSGLGAIPGIGASVIDWIAYGHAARSEKGATESFGKGDVRGVIASESSNNAKEGGALIPTIAFGVPGSASMALLLGAFLIHGLVPGPKMLTEKLDVTYTLVWSVALANIFGAGICFAFTKQLAKIAQVRVGILVPVVLAITFVGAFQGSKAWGDLYALLLFGLLGWIMKRLRWPRPPMVIGFVLGGLVESYMFISVNRYGAEWLGRPAVIAIGLITLFGIARPIIRNYRNRMKDPAQRRRVGFQKQNIDTDLLFSGAVAAIFATAVLGAAEWELAARLVPQVIGGAGFLFVAVFIVMRLFIGTVGGAAIGGQGAAHFDIQADYGDLSAQTIFARAVVYFLWCLIFLGFALVIGLLPALFVLLVGYMRFVSRESWKMVVMVSVPVWAFSYGLFHYVLRVPWPPALLGDWFPVLRTLDVVKFF